MSLRVVVAEDSMLVREGIQLVLDRQPDLEVIAACAGVDVLLHDGQFLDQELRRARAYGHATIGDALRLADRCGVGRLVLTHHAPDRSDDELDRLAATVTCTPQGRPVSFARQGDVLQVHAATVRGRGRP